MGAKFIIDRRCSVKTSLTLIGLIEAIKYRGLLRRIHDLAAAGAIPPCDADARLDLVLPPQSGLPGGLTIGDLMAQSDALMSHRIACRQCASSPQGHVGGCIGYVPYPLSEGMEFLLWTTAVRALKGELPEGFLPTARSFAERAMSVRKTPFADGMRERGDIVGARPRLYQSGPVFKRVRLSSAQVLDAFFIHELIAGDDLRVHTGFLGAALAVARAMESAIRDEERRQAMVEDVEPYAMVHDLMTLALEQRLGVYVWP
jgi:hypothetical protein